MGASPDERIHGAAASACVFLRRVRTPPVKATGGGVSVSFWNFSVALTREGGTTSCCAVKKASSYDFDCLAYLI